VSKIKKFSTSLNGYNKNEINQFVKTVASEYDSMLNKLKKQDQQIEELQTKILEYKNMETTLNRALLIAEDASTQIKRMARDESKSIIEEAKRNASRIVNDSLLKSEKIAQETDNLKRKIILFKRKFRQALENQLEDIDTIEEDM